MSTKIVHIMLHKGDTYTLCGRLGHGCLNKVTPKLSFEILRKSDKTARWIAKLYTGKYTCKTCKDLWEKL